MQLYSKIQHQCAYWVKSNAWVNYH
jgi:hypothetical protein